MLELALSADRRYLPHAAATIHSALAAGGEVSIHLLHGAGMPARDLDALRRMAERQGGQIAFHELGPERVAALPGWEYIPAEMWFRVYLPELLPASDRVLYLDADTLVLDSLEPLARLDLGDRYLAAVRNLFLPEHADRPARLGLAAGQPYFNSGVLLLNLEALRRDGCQQALLELARSGDERLLFPDQDALNLVLGTRIVELEPRWNATNGIFVFPWAGDAFDAESLARARHRPAIRHFEGPGVAKPWHLLFEFPHREAYLTHRRQTPWPRVRREGLNPRNLALRLARRAARRGPWPPPGAPRPRPGAGRIRR